MKKQQEIANFPYDLCEVPESFLLYEEIVERRVLNVDHLAHGNSLVESDVEERIVKGLVHILPLVGAIELPEVFVAIFLEGAVKCKDVPHYVFSRFDCVEELLLDLKHFYTLLEVSQCSRYLRANVEGWGLAALPTCRQPLQI